MAAQHHTRLAEYFHPDDPAGRLGPGDALMVGGLDFTWCFACYWPIPEFPGYCAGSNGMIWSRRVGDRWGARLQARWRRLKPRRLAGGGGYLTVTLCRDGINSTRSVHRLVAEVFLGPCPDGKECCHFPDADRANNRSSNLRWDTRRGNHLDKRDQGSARSGSRSHFSRLLEADIPLIRESRKAGRSAAQIAADFGVSKGTIRLVINGETWRHVPENGN